MAEINPTEAEIQPCLLFSLPPELREMIYSYLTTDFEYVYRKRAPREGLVSPRVAVNNARMLNILLSNRQLYNDYCAQMPPARRLTLKFIVTTVGTGIWPALKPHIAHLHIDYYLLCWGRDDSSCSMLRRIRRFVPFSIARTVPSLKSCSFRIGFVSKCTVLARWTKFQQKYPKTMQQLEFMLSAIPKLTSLEVIKYNPRNGYNDIYSGNSPRYTLASWSREEEGWKVAPGRE